ncbi:MAG TPA: hypothetical protein VL381_06955 [Rhodocyclaceae bacterium]|jgi:predicted lipoprotein with Yx(FWY)xxD motif|nr:hypothetical protein [Rhodocyclaceae bacterium]
MKKMTAVFALALMAVGSTQAQSVATNNGLLTDASGRVLYTFDKDDAGKSNCNGACVGNWPPFFAAADAKGKGDYSVMTRDDGIKQWAFKGKPLYYFTPDTKPGDTNGDGKGGVWHVIKLGAAKGGPQAAVPVGY